MNLCERDLQRIEERARKSHGDLDALVAEVRRLHVLERYVVAVAELECERGEDDPCDECAPCSAGKALERARSIS